MNILRSIFRFILGSLAAAAVAGSPFRAAESEAACQLNSLGNQIKHVIFIIFDNVHFRRDNPNVPSDLEQMPNLLNFIRNNGTLMTNDHTILISHTAGGILTNLTGVYPDRHGQAVANSYRYFLPNGSTLSSSSFKYWTDLVDDTGTPPADALPNMVNGDSGSPKTMPAPWVPYTRAGCDFGSAGGPANIVLENTGTGPNGDMTKVFGVNSAEWNEAVASNAAPRTPRHATLHKPTSLASPSIVGRAAASALATPMLGPTSCLMSRAATAAFSGSSARNTSTPPSTAAARE